MQITRIFDGDQLSVSLLDYGARVVGIEYSAHSMALSYPDPKDYLNDIFYLGATVGPIANRVANAQLAIDDQCYQLPVNEGNNCLHSGGVGLDKKTWHLLSANESEAIFECVYDLAQMGMRGALSVQAHYSVRNGELSIEYRCESDMTTYVNLTNHVYLNLSGRQTAIEDHDFELYADSFVAVDQQNIPTGEMKAIESPMTYAINRPARAEFSGAIDHHFNTSINKLMTACSQTTGIQLIVSSDCSGFQFYTGKFLDQPFVSSAGFCVETQLPPDAINQPGFNSPLLEAGDLRQQRTVFQFSRA